MASTSTAELKELKREAQANARIHLELSLQLLHRTHQMIQKEIGCWENILSLTEEGASDDKIKEQFEIWEETEEKRKVEGKDLEIHIKYSEETYKLSKNHPNGISLLFPYIKKEYVRRKQTEINFNKDRNFSYMGTRSHNYLSIQTNIYSLYFNPTM